MLINSIIYLRLHSITLHLTVYIYLTFNNNFHNFSRTTFFIITCRVISEGCSSGTMLILINICLSFYYSVVIFYYWGLNSIIYLCELSLSELRERGKIIMPTRQKTKQYMITSAWYHLINLVSTFIWSAQRRTLWEIFDLGSLVLFSWIWRIIWEWYNTQI